uniref:SLC41A/MgtE integral membrane domain-containing protein n=1 Tax=Meloidogyne incognita TaxID=6306 RepID=A0A914LN21_MELIC
MPTPKNFTNSPISNGKIDVIEMKRRSKPEKNNIDCLASSSFKNIALTDDTENINDQDNSDNDTTFVENEFVELPPLTGRDPHGHSNVARPEPALVLLFQVLFPFIIAGLGMVFAGLVFDQVQHWSFYKEVPQALILVPALLGLKGNLEMTLASRLSTQSNIGKLDSLQEAYSIIIANIALIQAQAIVVTFLATASAMALSWIPRGQLDWEHATLLGASAVSTASFASLALSLVMIAVIMTAKRWDINPDNVATPIAASLGDLTTLTILSVFGSVFLSAHRTQHWLNMFIILLFIFILPICIAIASRDSSARQVLRYGWSPIIFSMMISSSGGFVLERAVMNFQQMPLYQPVMNGVGGNLTAVAASKLSTFYHQCSTIGTLPFDWTIKRFYSFSRAFFSSDEDSRSARVFLLLCVPGHIFFNWVISSLHVHTGQYVQGSLFTALYLSAALAQVMILLYICQWLVPLMWIWKQNPDNAAIPYLTALGDLLGTAFLYAAFCLLNVLKPEDLINHSSSSQQQNQQEHQQQHQKSALELMSIPPIFSNNSVITSTNNSIDF